MKILVLMGGQRISRQDEQYPVYMAEINKCMVVEEQIRRFQTLAPSQIVYCLKQEDINDFHVDDILRHSAESSVFVTIHGQTAGAVCTALLAAEHIDNEEELLISAVDELIDTDYTAVVEKFRKNGNDAGLLSFASAHPRYSYAKTNPAGFVVEVAEKHPISRNALASFYYFKHGRDFVRCAKSVVQKDNPLNDAFYISQTVNEMILEQKKVGMENFAIQDFHPLKNESQLLEYLFDLRKEA